MKKFILPKGTLVKHGTTLCQVPSILKFGLDGTGNFRDLNREARELSPETSGVYVGNLISYFAAYAAYTSRVNPELSFPDYQKALKLYDSNPQSFTTLTIPDLLITLPVVLTIRLEEDCTLYADEDFVDNGKVPFDEKIPEQKLVSEAETVWNNYQTGCVIRDGGIPPNWIKEIEYPELSKPKILNRPSKQLTSDCDFFASGLRQSFLKKQPKPILKSLQKRYRTQKLSNSIVPTNKNVEQLFDKAEFSNVNNRLFNHFNILLLTESMARNYDVQLS
jgi:hypothetical protein